MNKERPRSVQEAMSKLLHYGFQECTQAASEQNGIEYLCAFERTGDEQGVCYACVTDDDLFVLLSLVEADACTAEEAKMHQQTQTRSEARGG